MPSQIAISTFYSLSISKTFTFASNDSPFYCHCEERSDEAIYFLVCLSKRRDCHAHLRRARNDKKVDCLGFLLESLAMTDNSRSLRGAKRVRDLVYDSK